MKGEGGGEGRGGDRGEEATYSVNHIVVKDGCLQVDSRERLSSHSGDQHGSNEDLHSCRKVTFQSRLQ